MSKTLMLRGGTFYTTVHSVEDFWLNVDKSGWHWLWEGPCNESGYGRFRYQGRDVYAHRFAYEALHGPTPEGQFVLHDVGCNEPRCVRHLHLGNQKQNCDERDAQDRVRHGSAHANAILTKEIVLHCRSVYVPSDPVYGMTALADRYNVAHSTMKDAIRGRTWRRAAQNTEGC